MRIQLLLNRHVVTYWMYVSYTVKCFGFYLYVKEWITCVCCVWTFVFRCNLILFSSHNFFYQAFVISTSPRSGYIAQSCPLSISWRKTEPQAKRAISQCDVTSFLNQNKTPLCQTHAVQKSNIIYYTFCYFPALSRKNMHNVGHIFGVIGQ